MVSNTLGLDLEWLRATVERLATECRDDPEYAALRKDLPADWPL
jgi:hypothetical protein